MSKNDFFLQLIFIAMTAALVSLIAVKVYPSSVLSEPKVNAASTAKEQAKIKTLTANLYTPKKISKIKDQTYKKVFYPPVFLSIKTIKMNLTIMPGIIIKNEWTLYDDKVSWLSTSEMPGQGNVILYAHSRVGLFGDLKRLSTGDEISVRDSFGREHLYEVVEKRKVLPTDTDAIISDKSRLTLYTCDGTFDQKRLLVIAFPKKDKLVKSK